MYRTASANCQSVSCSACVHTWAAHCTPAHPKPSASNSGHVHEPHASLALCTQEEEVAVGTVSVHAMAASTCACAHTQQSACEHDCCSRLGFGALLACWVPLQWCSAWRAHPLAPQGLHTFRHVSARRWSLHVARQAGRPSNERQPSCMHSGTARHCMHRQGAQNQTQGWGKAPTQPQPHRRLHLPITVSQE
jgi:hypothetical protein